MSFAADAIGFYLQISDQLTPALAKAERGYARFVKAIDKANAKAFKSSSKGFEALATLVESFDDMPKRAAKSYTESLKAMRRKVKPLTQQVNLQFTPKSTKAISAAVSQAVARALSKIRLRMTPTASMRRSPLYDASEPLRTGWKKQKQPPDWIGKFQGIPKFAKGGMVPGPNTGKDSVLAWLQPGELVVPKDVVKGGIRNDSGRFIRKDSEMTQALADIANLTKGLSVMQKAIAAGVAKPGDIDAYNEGLKLVEQRFTDLTTATSKYSAKVVKQVLPAITDAREGFSNLTEGMRDHAKETDELTGKWTKFFSTIMGATRFSALNRAIGQTQSALNELTGAAAQSGITGKIEGYYDAFYEMNQVLGMTRSELHAFGKEVVARSAQKWGGILDPTEIAAGASALVEAGMTNKGDIRELAGDVMVLAKSTGIAQSSIAEMHYKYAGLYGQTTDEINNTVMTMGRLVKFGGISAAQLDELRKGMDETLGAYALQTNMSGTQMQKYQRSMLELATAFESQWAGAGSGMVQKMAEGFVNPEAWSAIAMHTGLQIDTLNNMIQQGDVGGVIDAITGKMQQLAGTNPLLLGQLKEAFGFEGTTEQFAALIKQGDKVRDVYKQIATTGLNIGDTSAEMQKRGGATQGWWDQLFNNIGNFIQSNIPDAFIEFFDGVNLQAAHSAVYLGKFAIEVVRAIPGLSSLASGLFTAMGRLLGFKAATAATAATQAAAAATSAGAAATTTAAANAASFSLVGLAKGVGALIAQVGVGVGGAFAGIMAGIAKGLVALGGGITGFGTAMMTPPGKVGFVFLTVGIFALAGAMSWVLSSLVPVLTALQKVDAGTLLAVGPALAMFGVGFLGFATSLLAGSLLLGLAAVGFALFGGPGAAMKALGAFINEAAQAFQIDAGALETAAKGMKAAASFMGDLAFLSAAMMASGVLAGVLVGGGVIGYFLKGIGNLLFGDPMQNLIDSASQIKTTVNTLAATFAGNVWAKELPEAAKGIKAAGDFMGAIANISDGIEKAGRLAYGGVWGAIRKFFGGDAIKNAAQAGPDIARVTNKLADTFAGIDPSENLPKAADTAKQMSEFMGGLGTLAETIEKVSGLTKGGVFGALSKFFSGDALSKAESAAPKMSEIGTTLLNSIASIYKSHGPVMQRYSQTATDFAGFLWNFRSVVENLNLLGYAMKTQGDYNIGILTGKAESAVPKMSKIGTTLLNSIASIYKSHGPDMQRYSQTATDFAGFLWNFRNVVENLSLLGYVMKTQGDYNIGILAGKAESAVPKMSKIGTTLLNSIASIYKSHGPDMQRYSQNATDFAGFLWNFRNVVENLSLLGYVMKTQGDYNIGILTGKVDGWVAAFRSTLGFAGVLNDPAITSGMKDRAALAVSYLQQLRWIVDEMTLLGGAMRNVPDTPDVITSKLDAWSSATKQAFKVATELKQSLALQVFKVATELKQSLSLQVLTPEQIQTTVAINGHVTSEDRRTHELLQELLIVVRSQQRPVPHNPAPGARPASSDTEKLTGR